MQHELIFEEWLRPTEMGSEKKVSVDAVPTVRGNGDGN